MGKLLTDMKLKLEESLEEKLQLLCPGFTSYRILKKSIDARAAVPHWIISLEAFSGGEVPENPNFDVTPLKGVKGMSPVVIVGAGPAGLFAALRLAERGVPCLLLEQGSNATDRMK